MTALDRPVKRLVTLKGGKDILLTVIMDPRGCFLFREYGCHKWYAYPMMKTYRLAVEADKAERKRKTKKEK